MKNLFLILAINLLASFAFAVAEQVPKSRTITQISVYKDGATIYYTPAFPNTQCSGAKDTSVFIDWSEDVNNKLMLGQAQLALMSGTKVGFGITGCTSSLIPLIYRVDSLSN